MNARSDIPQPDEHPLRVPPSSVEAEQALLGALLLDNDAFGQVAHLVSAGSFYRQDHGAIFTAIAGLVSASKPADVVTVFEALRSSRRGATADDLAYLNSLACGVPGSRNAARHAEIVREKAFHRALIAAADNALALAWQPGPVGEKLDAIAASFSQLERGTMRRAPRSIAEIAIERVAYYEALERGEVEPGWATGIPRLDDLLNGGLRAGGFYILGARPKVGKSSLALFIAESMARNGRPTLVLSQEMPDAEVADRAVVHVGRIDYSSLMSGNLRKDGWERAADALDVLKCLPLFVDDQPALTLTEIRSKARMVKGLKVLVVDYLQLCSGANETENRNTQIEAISRGLKALAKNERIAVLALSQLNRKVEERTNKRPILSDLRDSGSIEQDADAVLLMWPFKDFPRERRKIIGLSVEANRQGPNGEVALDFQGSIQRWAESTADLAEQTAQPRRSAGFE